MSRDSSTNTIDTCHNNKPQAARQKPRNFESANKVFIRDCSDLYTHHRQAATTREGVPLIPFSPPASQRLRLRQASLLVSKEARGSEKVIDPIRSVRVRFGGICRCNSRPVHNGIILRITFGTGANSNNYHNRPACLLCQDPEHPGRF